MTVGACSKLPFETTRHHSEPANVSARRVAAFYELMVILERHQTLA